MNNNLLLENYLLILKSTIEVYIHGTLESSNQDVRKILYVGLEETLKNQDNVYKQMVNNNYYIVENVNSISINKLLNKIDKNS